MTKKITIYDFWFIFLIISMLFLFSGIVGVMFGYPEVVFLNMFTLFCLFMIISLLFKMQKDSIT